MKSLVIGSGEVGKALYNVIGGDITALGQYDIIHICFPYSDEFVSEVKRYQELYKPRYTVIHSTVPVGTTTRCKAHHSPTRGVHPHLEEGLRTFIKYLAPANQELKEYFEKAGIKIKLIDRPENTEALKLWSTTQYGRFIELEKEIHKYCEERGLDFNIIYNESNKTYNEGYEKLGMGHVRRPILKHIKGDIGGHCILPNYKLLNKK